MKDAISDDPGPPGRRQTHPAARRGLEEAPRITLRRQVTTAAAAAASEQEFFARLGHADVLVRKRFSVKSPGQVTGYSVALPGDTAKDGGLVWYGGGILAADLSWPKLRQRWNPTRAAPGRPHLNLTAGERNAVWEHATRAAADATAQIRNLAWTDAAAAADAAWATSDTCTWPPRCSAAASFARPPTPTTAPPAHPMAASLSPPPPGTSSARPPGCYPRWPA